MESQDAGDPVKIEVSTQKKTLSLYCFASWLISMERKYQTLIDYELILTQQLYLMLRLGWYQWRLKGHDIRDSGVPNFLQDSKFPAELLGLSIPLINNQWWRDR